MYRSGHVRSLSNSPEPHNNNTTSKQKLAMSSLNAPYIVEIEDAPIVEETGPSVLEYRSPEVEQPRRSMMGHRSLWKEEKLGDNSNPMLELSDDYYNQTVAAKTKIFLTRMAQMLR